MAQQKHCVVYRETDKSHLKLVGKLYQYLILLMFQEKNLLVNFLSKIIGKLYDQCQDTLVQFGTFLGSTMTVDEYVERLPSIHSMLQDNHIHSDVAFFLARPMFAHAINVIIAIIFFFKYHDCIQINNHELSLLFNSISD